MRIFCLFVTLGLCAVAHAQPPANSEATKNPANWGEFVPIQWTDADARAEIVKRMEQLGPLWVVTSFLGFTEEGKWQRAAMCVAGVNDGHPALDEMRKMSSDKKRFHNWTLDDETLMSEHTRVKAMADLPARLEVKIDVSGTDEMGVEQWRTEAITLVQQELEWGKGKKHEAGKARVWRIVAPQIKELEAAGRADKSLGVIGSYAAMLAEPMRGLNAVGRRRAGEKGKKLALAMAYFLADHNDVYDLTAESARQKLKPYVEDEALWTAPGDEAGMESFRFNGALTGKSRMEAEKNETILFYVGENQKPQYRFLGMSPIVYAAGHVKMQREGAALRWEP